MKQIISFALVFSLCLSSCATQVYSHKCDYKVRNAAAVNVATKEPARNVILMIGDGMGSEHVWAAWLANEGKLNITSFPVTGFSITTSASHAITDSAAGGTAIACGCKAINGQLGMDPDGEHHESLAVQMRRAGKATGFVVTKSVTDATPAAFYAHVESRKDTPAIAEALVSAGFDVVAGGGGCDFTQEQKDGLQKSCKLLELVASKECEPAGMRGNWLPETVESALEILEKDEDGFFLMVEGSKIDISAHVNDLPETVREVLDFDRAVGVVLQWMKKNPDTLLVVTADHQTGGLSLLGGDKAERKVEGKFTTFDHSGVAVPVYAAGVGAAQFSGVMDNTELAPKILRAARVER